MKLFLLFFITINTAVNFCLYWRLRPLLPKGRAFSWLFAAFIVLMLLFALVSRRLYSVLGDTSYDLYDVGVLWFGFSLLAIQTALLSFLLQAAVKLLSRRLPKLKKIAFNNRLFALICLLPALLAFTYGIKEARAPYLDEISIVSSRLQAGSYTLLHLNDLHLGSMGSYKYLENALDFVEQTNPDIIVLTGDILDGIRPVPMEWSEAWSRLNPPLGKYAVLGNHEIIDHYTHNLEFLERSGFTLLRNQGVKVGDNIYIAGVDDPAFNNPVDETTLWDEADPALYRILLKHRPDVVMGPKRTFDLQLSGHTHGGQIYPGYWLTKIVFPMNQGLYLLNDGNYLYVNKGIGTWGAPVRFMTPPQAALFTITSIMQPEE